MEEHSIIFEHLVKVELESPHHVNNKVLKDLANYYYAVISVCLWVDS